ncbi:hypothetical protein LINPERHAP2_LOCUS10912, partial [Linum perenne]
ERRASDRKVTGSIPTAAQVFPEAGIWASALPVNTGVHRPWVWADYSVTAVATVEAVPSYQKKKII